LENTVNTDLIRDHVDSFILRFLANGDSYGYDIHKAISTATEGVYEIKQPTLYSCLKRLEKQGFITSYDGETSNGAQRKYYAISDKGRAFLEDDIKQWEFSRTLLNRLLSDKEFDLASAPHPFDPSELRPRTKRGVGVRRAGEADESIDDTSIADSSDDDYSSVESSIEPVPEMTDQYPERINEEASSDSPAEIASDIADDGQESTPSIFGAHVTATQIDMETFAAEEAEKEAAQKPILQDFLDENVSRNDDYLTPLNDIFTTNRPASPAIPKEEPEEINRSAFNYSELKERAQAEGYKLHPYSKAASTSYYSMNFIFSSKLKRDSLLLLYVFMLIEVFVAYFALDRFAHLGYLFYIVTACVLMLCPIVGIVFFLMKPDKRVRADFDFRTALSGTIMLTINLFIICMLFAFFLFHADLGNPSTLVRPLLYPGLLFINLPVYSVIYALLYGTKHYHLK